MTFHIYNVQADQNPHTLVNTGHEFSLAGENLLREAWRVRNCPVNVGWKVGADELVRILSRGSETYASCRLIIDYHPSNMDRIPLIEILEIFAFSWGTQQPTVIDWTPLMFRMRDVWDHWSETTMIPTERDRLKARIVDPPYGDEFVEFLYLQGDDGSWNWGRNGSTNAAFIHGAARDYFRQNF
jgi:hypothetical protein